MQVPIPSDWNGEKWQCVQIQWPDSPEFWGLLNGLLTMLTRGRYWDEKTGSVKGAQDVAWEIFNRNWPLRDCETGSIVYPPESQGGGIVIYEDDDMGQVVTNVELIKGGIRVYFGHCCYEDLFFDVQPGATAGTGNPIDDPDVPQDWYACGKASGLIDAMATLVQSGLDNYTSPLTFNGNVKASLPSIEMSADYLYLYLFDLIAITKAVSNENIINDDLVQKFKCQSAPRVSSAPEVTADELAAVISAMKGVVQSENDYAASELIWTLWEQAYQIIGPGDAMKQMEIGAAQQGNCTCPDVPVEQGDFSFNGILDSYVGDNGTIDDVYADNGGRRVFATYNFNSGSFKTIPNARFGIVPQPATSITSCTIRAYPQAGTLDFVMKEWNEQGQPVPVSDWSDATPYGPASYTEARENDAGYYDIVFTNMVGVVNNIEIASGRPYQDSLTPQQFKICLEIIEVNGKQLTPIGPGQ